MAWESEEATPEEIQSRICWYIKDRLKGRRAEVSLKTGYSTSTLDRYCNYHDASGLGSLKLIYTYKILAALGEAPSMVMFAAEQATSPQQMRFLAARRVDDEDMTVTAFRRQKRL